MRTHQALLLSALFSLLLTCETFAEVARYQVEIAPGDLSRDRLPVCIDVAVPEALKDVAYAIAKLSDGAEIPAQVAKPDLLAEPIELKPGQVHRQIWCVPGKLEAGRPVSIEVTILTADVKPTRQQFSWTNTAGKYAELSFGDRVLLRYMYEPIDESSGERRAETYKVYHHVFDPSGKQLLTKGPGGLFPHHRGLFFGFNRISYDNKSADTWHCTGKAHQSHREFVSEEAGPVLGRHVVKVGWHGQDGEVFAEEDRELTVYRQPTDGDKPIGTLIEIASVLRSKNGEIKLDGDPQHAGFQFRASQEVPDKTAKETYYIRTTGIGKPGKYLNWPDQKDQVNFPWKGMSVVIGGERYTIANLDRPENPKESRFSERDYGRFGSYFVTTVTPDKPLKLNYRIWVQPGEMMPEQIEALANDFTEPVKVTVQQL